MRSIMGSGGNRISLVINSNTLRNTIDLTSRRELIGLPTTSSPSLSSSAQT